MTWYGELLPVAVEAIEIASALVREGTPGDVTPKGDRDMVSQLDHTVEDQVRRFLRRRTPELGVLGEESGASGPAGAAQWVLDPIDGTANLLHGLPLCAISLALIDADQPVLGVIDLPFLGNRYVATAGQGATADGQPIHVRKAAGLHEAMVTIGDYAVGVGAEAKNRRRLATTARLAGRVQRVRMFGTAAVDLAWLAQGRTDACVILSNNPWDMAAGVVIAREAGATVVDRDGSPYHRGSSATIATAPHLADDIVELVAAAHRDADTEC